MPWFNPKHLYSGSEKMAYTTSTVCMNSGWGGRGEVGISSSCMGLKNKIARKRNRQPGARFFITGRRHWMGDLKLKLVFSEAMALAESFSGLYYKRYSAACKPE